MRESVEFYDYYIHQLGMLEHLSKGHLGKQYNLCHIIVKCS